MFGFIGVKMGRKLFCQEEVVKYVERSIILIRTEVQKIMSGRRISLSDEWMEENNMKVGDWVIIKPIKNGIEVIPAMIIPKVIEKI
ncbi:MAG: hypothetical protein ACRD9Q_08075 [Nitrososphaeraceae archaeon]